MNRNYAVGISLQELEKVNLSLNVLALKAKPPLLEVARLIKRAQNELGLLETSMRNNPDLIQAQIGLMEASVLSTTSRLEEAIQTAYSHVHWFLESMRRLK